jgi:enamine deaminase RidA (YjgF/YER057c/UK114 family)
MTQRQQVFSGSPFESVMGYARALRVGWWVAVSGTTAPGSDTACQAAEIMRRIAGALQEVGAELGDVVRTRVHLTDIADFDAVARVHGAVFGEIRPATTFVAVAALADPALRVEIEADAVVFDD